MGLSAEEKRRLLKALEEDEEFRLAVAGLIGLGEVIQELRRLREDFDKWVKKTERWWRQNEKRWQTWYNTWQKFLEDYERRWKEEEERWKTWHNTWQKFQEDYEKRWQTWFETWQKFLEDYQMRWKEQADKWEDAKKRFARIEAVLAASVEAQFSRYVWEDILAEVKASGESVLKRVRNADFDGVDVDFYIETEKRAFVVEVKVRPRIEDVGALLAKAEVVQRSVGKPVVAILTGAQIGGDVKAYAKGKGVLVYEY